MTWSNTKLPIPTIYLAALGSRQIHIIKQISKTILFSFRFLIMSCTPEEFPPLWQKPAFRELMDCLQRLRVDPPIWNYKISRQLIDKEQENRPHVRREVASFLSGIIKSSLEWVEDEDQREDLWTEASKRMSERCGRAGT